MKYAFTVLALLCLVLPLSAQWSRDPGEALLLPEIPIGYSISTDSLGGVFVIGAEWNFDDFSDSRTYCTYVSKNGEFYWNEWIAFMPGVDLDRPLGVYVCPEPGYLITVLFAEQHVNGDTLWQIRAQKVSAEGELMWPDSGVSVSSTRLRDETTTTDMIGAVGDSEGGLIIVWAMQYYRILPSDDRILERQSFRAQRLSPDGESLWGDNGIEVIPDDSLSWFWKTVPDGEGGVIMVDYYQTSRSDFFIGGQRISPHGEKLWGDSGVLYRLNSYLVIGDAIPDRHGGVVFSGQAAQEDRWQVRVFRLNTEGEQIWGDGNGVIVKDVHHSQGQYLTYNYVEQASDSIFFFHWKGDGEEEPRSLIQSVDLAGNLKWEWPGLTICDADTAGHTVRGVSSLNSVIYGWYGYRPSEERVAALFCQRLDEQGNRLWADEGIMLFDRRGMSISNVITDCNGGAIFRIGRYLQLVNRDGELGVPLTIRSIDQPLAPGVIAYSLFPNPTNGSVTLEFLSPSVTDRQIKLFDLQGRSILHDLIPSGVSSFSIDVSDYPSGNYILQISPEAPDAHRILNIIK